MSDRAQQEQDQAPQGGGGGGGGNTPPGMEALVFGPWTTTNTDGSRPAIRDNELFWTDGFMPIGIGRLRTMPGAGPALFTAGVGLTVVFFDFFNIGGTPYCFVVTSDGAMSVFVTSPAGAPASIAPAGTITTPTASGIGITQWGSLYLLIVAEQTNGYWIWDGTTFYAPGAAVPGFTTVPMGVGGSAIEIYQQHVWIANAATVLFSAPQSITDFATASGGGTFTSIDSFLRVAIVSLKATNGFLYLIGDSSINYISGVATSGGPPPVTTFTNQNADPEVGSPWAASVDVLSSAIVMANPWGAHISYGGRVSKISTPMDGVYLNAAFPTGFTPSACKATVFGKRIWCLLMPIKSPLSGTTTNTLLMYEQDPSGPRWWLGHQDVALNFVQHEEVFSLISAYGTDSTSIYKLFQTASTGFQKSFQTKLRWPREGYLFDQAASRLWGLMQVDSTSGASVTVDIDNDAGGAFTPVVWTASATGISVLPPTAVSQQGTLLGLTCFTSAADISIISIAIGADIWSYKG